MAVYTNVTSDHLDRHGSLEAYRAVKRRLAELVPPTAPSCSTREDPVVARYGEIGEPRPSAIGGTGRCLAGSGSSTAGSWRPTSSACLWPVAGRRRPGPMAGSCRVGELAIPGAHNVSNALAAVAVGLLFGVAPDAIRGAAAAFTGVEHRLEPVAVIDGVRFVNDSQGTQPDAVIAALRGVRCPGRAHRRRPRQGRGPRRAGRGRGRARRGRGRSSARPAPISSGGSARPGLERIERAGSMDEAVTRAAALARAASPVRRLAPTAQATVLLSPAAASFDMFPTTRPAAVPSRTPLPRSRPADHATQQRGTDEPRAAGPAFGRGPPIRRRHPSASAPATSAGARIARRPSRRRSCSSASGTTRTT